MLPEEIARVNREFKEWRGTHNDKKTVKQNYETYDCGGFLAEIARISQLLVWRLEICERMGLDVLELVLDLDRLKSAVRESNLGHEEKEEIYFAAIDVYQKIVVYTGEQAIIPIRYDNWNKMGGL